MRLTLCASKLWRISRDENFAHEEVAVFNAPSECYGDIAAGFRRAYLNTLNEFGYTPDSFIEELRARTTEKFSLYAFGFWLPGVDNYEV